MKMSKRSFVNVMKESVEFLLLLVLVLSVLILSGCKDNTEGNNGLVNDDSYCNEFVDVLMNNLDSWATPDWNYDEESMIEKISFMDIDFDGRVELVCTYVSGSGGPYAEVYSCEDGNLIHLSVAQESGFVDFLNCYYNYEENSFKTVGLDATSFCDLGHKNNSECEITIRNNVIYKDYFVTDCQFSDYCGYYILENDESDDGYSAMKVDKEAYDDAKARQLEGFTELTIERKYITSDEWNSYTDTEKAEALKSSYNGFEYH